MSFTVMCSSSATATMPSYVNAASFLRAVDFVIDTFSESGLNPRDIAFQTTQINGQFEVIHPEQWGFLIDDLSELIITTKKDARGFDECAFLRSQEDAFAAFQRGQPSQDGKRRNNASIQRPPSPYGERVPASISAASPFRGFQRAPSPRPSSSGAVSQGRQPNSSIQTISFSVKTPSNNKSYDLQASPQATVAFVKVLVAEVAGVAYQDQRLIFAGKELQNAQTLRDVKVVGGSNILMVARPPGGSAPAPFVLSVTTTGGKTITVRVPAQTDAVPVGLVCDLIERAEKLPSEKQRLMSGGQQLQRDKFLSSYGIKEGSRILLV
ncbi:hypothetical protein CPB85DRAFT_1253147 [Mucidula mucida]|nr:hypothetical protein CPB85DRAFT_1253147 [Mucidula mucida]